MAIKCVLNANHKHTSNQYTACGTKIRIDVTNYATMLQKGHVWLNLEKLNTWKLVYSINFEHWKTGLPRICNSRCCLMSKYCITILNQCA